MLVERRGDLERERGGLVEHHHVARDELDGTRREVLVRVSLGTGSDRTGHLQDVLVAQPVRDRLVTDDDLRDPGRVTEVDECDTAVITAPVDPTREGDGLADVLGSQ